MEMTPTVVIAIATFMVLWTSTVLVGAGWISKQLKSNRDEIIFDFNAKHEANNKRYEALHALVIRHDVLLDPEFREIRRG